MGFSIRTPYHEWKGDCEMDVLAPHWNALLKAFVLLLVALLLLAISTLRSRRQEAPRPEEPPRPEEVPREEEPERKEEPPSVEDLPEAPPVSAPAPPGYVGAAPAHVIEAIRTGVALEDALRCPRCHGPLYRIPDANRQWLREFLHCGNCSFSAHETRLQ